MMAILAGTTQAPFSVNNAQFEQKFLAHKYQIVYLHLVWAAQ